jgi:F-type H+-transporting ATPase subunit delta
LTGNIVARRYARALFAIGQAEGDAALQSYGSDLANLSEVLADAPELVKIFRNPIFSVEEKKGVVKKVMEKTGPTPMVANFCSLLADKDRLACLPEIEKYYSELLDTARGLLRGELVTAVKLTDKMQKDVQSRLETQAGKTLALEFEVDKEILGGLMLKVGDKVLDASIRAQLEILKENIKRGE